jgi:cell division protein FtsZ
MIFGAVIDPNMGDDVRITVIATGFERTGVPRRAFATNQRSNESSRPAGIPIARQQESVSVAAAPVQHQQSGNEFRPTTLNTDDLDIPTFLRNRR